MRSLSAKKTVKTDQIDSVAHIDELGSDVAFGLQPTDAGTTVIGERIFPQPTIQAALARVVTIVYGINWQPRVVRQQRHIPNSSLDFIDYAVPCFDLAKTLALSPDVVANELASAIKRDSKNLHGFKAEAVAGYVNFQVPNSFITRALESVATWLVSPHSLAQKRSSSHFLMAGPVIGQDEDFKLTDEVCNYVGNIYRLLDEDYSMRYLVSDTSEQAIDYLIQNWADKSGDIEATTGRGRILLRRRIEAALSASNKDNNDEVLVWLHDVQANWRTRREGNLQGLGIHRYKTIFEHEIIRKVHSFLDNEVQHIENGKQVGDSASLALYYGVGDRAFALRSAGGFLYRFSYLAYVLDMLVTQGTPMDHVVLVAPSRANSMMREFLEDMHGAATYGPTITYLDPKTLQANVVELQSTIGSLDDHFLKLAQLLRSLPVQSIGAKQDRKAILSVIDMPLAISEAASLRQLPTVLDLIDQSVQAETSLRR